MSSDPIARPVLENLESTGDLLVDLVHHLDAMLAYWDADQRCRFANRAYTDWFGRGQHELIGISLKELLGPIYEMNRPHIEAAYRGERQVFERAIPWPDGSGVRHSLATYIPRVIDGQVLGIFVHVADVEPLKRLERELEAARDAAQSLALHDVLTGLPNRRLLQERLAEAMLRSKRTQELLYVLSIDVDDFKSVNDTYGHAGGDTCLIKIAARIKSCLREYDTVARIGGDEFLVLVGGVPAGEKIETLVERILQSSGEPISLDNGILRPRISIGVAQFPMHGQSADEVMNASDRALYAAKNAGRSCFRVA